MRRFMRVPARWMASTWRRDRPSLPGGSVSGLFSKSALDAMTTPSGFRRSCDTMASRSSRERAASSPSVRSWMFSIASAARPRQLLGGDEVSRPVRARVLLQHQRSGGLATNGQGNDDHRPAPAWVSVARPASIAAAASLIWAAAPGSSAGTAATPDRASAASRRSPPRCRNATAQLLAIARQATTVRFSSAGASSVAVRSDASAAP